MAPSDFVTQTAAKCFSEVSNYPSLKTVWFDDEEGVYHAIWSQTHPVTKSKILSQRTVVNGFQTEPVPIADYGLMALNRTKHNSCYKKAYISNEKEDKGTRSYLDIYSNQGLAFRHDLTSYEMHGKVNDDFLFGCLVWSPDATHLAYIAEKKVPASKSFFDSLKKETEETVRGEEYRYRETWGENLVEVADPTICIIEISTGEISIPVIPPGISPFDLAWSDTHLYFIGASMEPFKVGMMYATNRETALYSLDNITKECVAITGAGRSVLSPRLDQDSERVLFLEIEPGGLESPHRNYATLKVFTLCAAVRPGEEAVPSGSVYTVPDSSDIAGIYCAEGSLPSSPWLDKHHIICTTTVKWRSIIVCIDIRTGEVIHSLNDSDVNYSIVDQIGSKALVSKSRANGFGGFQQQVNLLTLEVTGRMFDIEPLFNKDVVSEDTCVFKGFDFETDDRTYNGFLVSPKEKQNDKNTLLVFPHGGPHGASVAAFNPTVYGFCKLGYSVLMVNYTGSLGIDRQAVFDLVGNIGRYDVDDVHQATLRVMKEEGLRNVAVMGGSHGGFLAAHLIGQFPEVYQAAAIRNPIIDISTFSGITDIPDWCWYQAGLGYNASKPALPSPESLSKMLSCSPIQYVDRVKCPVLLLIGARDRCVHPSQGLRYYQYLRSRGVTTELLLYPDDSHAIASIPAAADLFVQTVKWFEKFIN